MKLFTENLARAIMVLPVIVLLMPGATGATARVVVGEMITNTS